MAAGAGLFNDLIEQRVIEYIVNELKESRELFTILDDPYVKNRIPETRINQILNDPDLLEAFKAEIERVRNLLPK